MCSPSLRALNLSFKMEQMKSISMIWDQFYRLLNELRLQNVVSYLVGLYIFFMLKINNKTAIAFVIMTLFVVVRSAKVQCQFETSNWQPGKRFYFSEREELVSTLYNMDIIVDKLDKTVSESIRNTGSWQPSNIRVLTRFVKEGDTVINIGSHVGLEALIMGKIIGSKGTLFIMEPFSITYNMVFKNVYLNGLANIATVYNVGASNKYSKGIISVDNINTGGSQIFTDQTVAKPAVKTEEVQVDRVDNILPKNAVIDFALIDVERSEIECLQGMKETIKRSPNIAIMCEWAGYSNNSKDGKKKIKDLIDWFLSLKFKFYRLADRSGNCSPQNFYEVTPEYVLSMPDPKDNGTFPDIFIIPEHIDPNKTF